jgi:hypothetical protein
MTVRAPRCQLSIGGTQVNPIECSVKQVSHQAADTFSATVAIGSAQGAVDASMLLSTAPMQVTVQGSSDGNASTQMFSGNVDNVTVDFENMTATLSGRDKTADLIDAKTNETWKNQQPQDVITKLAQTAGLSVQFNGEASDKAGLQYKDDFNKISELDSAWNVICRLAQKIGCVASVNGDQLVIAPTDNQSGGSSFQAMFTPPTGDQPAQGNCWLSAGRNLNLAKTITVTHQSWQQKQGQQITSTSTAQGKGDTIKYDLKGANLTKKQQDAIAKGRVNDVISHERTVTIHAPGDTSVNSQSSIQVSGTGTAADQQYIVSEVEHHWSWEGGYVMTISARNKDQGRSAS